MSNIPSLELLRRADDDDDDVSLKPDSLPGLKIEAICRWKIAKSTLMQ